MGTIERKVLGALLIMCNDERVVERVTQREIAKRMGYGTSGGVITIALQLLEMRNCIETERIGTRLRVKVLVS